MPGNTCKGITGNKSDYFPILIATPHKHYEVEAKYLKIKTDWNKILYPALLIVGFFCQILPAAVSLAWGNGAVTFIWLYVFLELVCRFRSKKQLLVTGIVFLLGYNLKFAGALGIAWVNLVLFSVFGLMLYGAFCASAYCMLRWNSFLGTLAFPVIWMLEYLLATLLRFPSLVRVDMMFTDMYVLIQAERLIGSFGLSFAILWIVSLFRYATATRKNRYVALGISLFLLLLMPGIFYMYPNVNVTDSVRVAYTTGPYAGDFLNYSAVSYDKCETSLQTSIQEAASQKAEILVFNEEAFEINDTQEPGFISLCSDLAREHSLAVLVGLDVKDTDGSEAGKSLNKLVFIGTDGEILGTYQKSRLIPILESDYEPGDGNIPSHQLELNGKSVKISYLICYDSNFPGYVKNVESDTDILFLPSWDWTAVTELHAKLCSAIASENHIAILKPTYDGITIAADPDGRIFHTTSTAETGYEQIHIVDMPIKSASVMTTRAEPLSAFTYATVGTEILSALICILLLVGNILADSEKTKRSKIFTAMVITDSIACIADALSWILDGCARLNPVLYASTILSLILTFVLIGEYIGYFTEYIREKRAISQWPLRVYIIFSTAAILITIITSFTGGMFTMVNGVYSDGPLYPAYVIVNVGSMVFGIVFITLVRKLLDFYDRVIAYLYLFIPILSAVINLFFEEWSFAYPASTLSLLLVYVMLQSDRVEQVRREGQIIQHYATHDELTGLFNRRAFRERMEMLQQTVGTSGIIFADVNGLKYANDNFGHEAGDRLLIRFAELLAKVFRIGEIYRISGDEFICMMENVEEQTFRQRVRDLENLLNQDVQPLACIGAAFGRNPDVEDLIQNAETIMYGEKDIFHEQFPKTKR